MVLRHKHPLLFGPIVCRSGMPSNAMLLLVSEVRRRGSDVKYGRALISPRSFRLVWHFPLIIVMFFFYFVWDRENRSVLERRLCDESSSKSFQMMEGVEGWTETRQTHSHLPLKERPALGFRWHKTTPSHALLLDHSCFIDAWPHLLCYPATPPAVSLLVLLLFKVSLSDHAPLHPAFCSLPRWLYPPSSCSLIWCLTLVWSL